MRYTDEQVTSANRLYKKVFEYGTNGAVALRLIIDFGASRDSRVRGIQHSSTKQRRSCIERHIASM